jgi:hypothetical protein
MQSKREYFRKLEERLGRCLDLNRLTATQPAPAAGGPRGPPPVPCRLIDPPGEYVPEILIIDALFIGALSPVTTEMIAVPARGADGLRVEESCQQWTQSRFQAAGRFEFCSVLD